MAIVKAKYFKESEFKACTPRCSMQDMSQQLMYMLDAAREIAGIPFVLNSAYRSKEWDKSKGRTGNSAHTRGLAVDIAHVLLCSSILPETALHLPKLPQAHGFDSIAEIFSHRFKTIPEEALDKMLRAVSDPLLHRAEIHELQVSCLVNGVHLIRAEFPKNAPSPVPHQ